MFVLHGVQAMGQDDVVRGNGVRGQEPREHPEHLQQVRLDGIVPHPEGVMPIGPCNAVRAPTVMYVTGKTWAPVFYCLQRG